MAYRIGSGSWLGFAEEATFGTSIITTSDNPDYYDYLKPGTLDIKEIIERVEVDSLQSGVGRYVADYLDGEKRVEGTFTQNPKFGGDGFAMFMAHLLGNAWTTTSGSDDNESHVLTIGATQASAVLAKGITMVVNRDGDRGSAADSARRFSGMRPVAVEFTFGRNELVTAEWTFLGAKADYLKYSSLPTPSLSAEPYMMLPSPKSGATAFLQVASTAYTARSGSVRIAIPYADLRSLEDQEMGSAPRWDGRIEVTGSFEVEFPGTGATLDTFTNAWNAGSTSQLDFTLVGADGSVYERTLAISIPRARMVENPEAYPDSAGVMTQTVEWAAMRDSSNANEGTITLNNTDAAAYTVAS
mgnify:CR=1 FL=1